MSQLLKFIPFLVIFSGLLACSSLEKKSDTAEGSFAIAADFDKDERYEEAIRRYTEVKNKFPYSSFAVKSELAIADVYYKQESYGEAQVAYQSFRELHPKHPQIDYVIFRLGLSYFNQLPSTIDRDLASSTDTLAAFDELMKKYPTSQYVNEAADKKLEVLKMLAGKEQYIADFYAKHENYDSALNRYENLLAKYPKMGFDDKAMYGAAYCAYKLNDPEKAHKYVQELQEKFPQSDETHKAERDFKL